MGCRDRIIWTGFLSGDELWATYSAADLFVLLSESENFGMVVVEALLCHLPVLVSPHIGVGDYLKPENVGLTVSMNIQVVSEVLERFLIEKSEWQNRVKKSRETAIKLFGLQRVAELMSQAFSDVIDGTLSSDCEWQ